MDAESAPRPRYGELVYTSTDRAVGGGWQVIATTGALDDAEVAALKKFVVTSFDSHQGSPPMYLDPARVDELPIRFGATAAPGGVAVWQATQAGDDSTGRPGNVFTQVVIDREPGRNPAPIELWRSPSFEMPYGAPAVARVALPPVFEARRSAVVAPDFVLEQILDVPSRGRLCVLLDAIAGARNGSGCVLLHVDDQDEAATLLAAVCALTVRAWAVGLRFTLYERANAVTAEFARRWHVAVVPMQDALDLPAGASCVMRLDEDPLCGDELRPHRTSRGDTIAVTAWSALVGELADSPEAVVSSVLSTLSGWEVSPDEVATVRPEWWLALAMSAATELNDAGLSAANGVLRGQSAPRLPEGERRMALERAFRDVRDPAALAGALEGVAVEDGRRDVLLARFVRECLRDLGRIGPTTIPAGAVDASGRRFGLPEQFAAAMDDLDEPTIENMEGLVGLLELAGWFDDGEERIAAPLVGAFGRLLLSIQPPQARVCVPLVRRLPADTRARVLTAIALNQSEEWQRAFLSGGPELRAEIESLDLDELRSAGRLLTPFGRMAADSVLHGRAPLLASDMVALVHELGPELVSHVVTAGTFGRAPDVRELRPREWSPDARAIAKLLGTAPAGLGDLATLVLEISAEAFRVLQPQFALQRAKLVEEAVRVRASAEDLRVACRWPSPWSESQDRRLLTDAKQLRSRLASSALARRNVWVVLAVTDLVVTIRALDSARVDEVALLRAESSELALVPVDVVELVRARLVDPADHTLLAYALAFGAARQRDEQPTGTRDVLAEALARVLRDLDPRVRGELIDEAEAVFERTTDAGRVGRLLRRAPVMTWAATLTARENGIQ